MKIDFIKKVSWKEAQKFLDEVEKRGLDNEIGLITEWGAVIPDEAVIIVELGEDSNYIATKGFLQRSDDEVFVRLKKDGKKIEMPNFEDVFKIISY